MILIYFSYVLRFLLLKYIKHLHFLNVTPLAKVEGKIRKFTPNTKTLTRDNLYALTVDQVTFSSLSTRIDLTFDYPKEMGANDS